MSENTSNLSFSERLKKLIGRFARFGVVGGSGIFVNQAVLYAGMEWLFVNIAKDGRLSYALPLAIAVATTYNFFWNRLWTWRERRAVESVGVAKQYAKYVAATLVGSSLQYVLTRYLASDAGFALHYGVANLIAIGIASVVNFLINDRVTFRKVTE
jgi:dolichol-phosphate mannosyltransferase